MIYKLIMLYEYLLLGSYLTNVVLQPPTDWLFSNVLICLQQING